MRDGVKCPVCRHMVKVTRFTLGWMAAEFIDILAERAEKRGGVFVFERNQLIVDEIEARLPRGFKGSVRGGMALLGRYWGLIKSRDDGTAPAAGGTPEKKNRFHALTSPGWKFSREGLLVRKHRYVYLNTAFAEDGPLVGIQQARKRKVKYPEILAGEYPDVEEESE